MLCKKLGVQFKVVSYDRNLWSQTLVCVCCFIFYLKECTIAACNFLSGLANSFHSREIKVPGFDTCCLKSLFFSFYIRLISASPDVLKDQFWAAPLFCGFSEQNQSSCEALGTTVFFKGEARAIFGDF